METSHVLPKRAQCNEGCGMPLKVRDVIKMIEAEKWMLVATRGSHRQYKHHSKPGRVTIPGKRVATCRPGWSPAPEASGLDGR